MSTITARNTDAGLAYRRNPRRKTMPELLSKQRTDAWLPEYFPDDVDGREYRLHPTKGWRSNRVVV